MCLRHAVAVPTMHTWHAHRWTCNSTRACSKKQHTPEHHTSSHTASLPALIPAFTHCPRPPAWQQQGRLVCGLCRAGSGRGHHLCWNVGSMKTSSYPDSAQRKLSHHSVTRLKATGQQHAKSAKRDAFDAFAVFQQQHTDLRALHATEPTPRLQTVLFLPPKAYPSRFGPSKVTG